MRTADVPRDSYPMHWPAARSWTRLAVRTRNPLLRPPTRRERVVTRLAFAGLIVLGLALTALCVGVFDRGTSAERAQSAQRQRITAVVQSAADPRVIGNRYLVAARAQVSYEFDGVTTTGITSSAGGARPGATVQVWVDRDGRLTTPPQTRSRTVRDVVLVALFGLTGLVVLVAGGRVGYDAWSVRQHADDWDAQWQRFDRERRG